MPGNKTRQKIVRNGFMHWRSTPDQNKHVCGGPQNHCKMECGGPQNQRKGGFEMSQHQQLENYNVANTAKITNKLFKEQAAANRETW
jgi:hypothetical protein